MILVPFGVANGQGRQPWPEEAWRVLRGASADLPRITLVPAGLRLLGPAGGWLYSQPHNDQGGPLFNGHRWSLIAFPFTDKLNRIVVRIHNLLGKPKTPSKKGIERTLKENNQVMKCFSTETRGKSKRYIYKLDTRASD